MEAFPHSWTIRGPDPKVMAMGEPGSNAQSEKPGEQVAKESSRPPGPTQFSNYQQPSYPTLNPLYTARPAGHVNQPMGGSPIFIAPMSPLSPLPTTNLSYSTRRIAIVVPAFVFTNFVVFIVTMYVNNCPANEKSRQTCALPFLGRFSFQPVNQNPLLGPSAMTLLRMGALESDLIKSYGQAWRLFTCMWLHAGVFHLGVNMIGLVCLGLQIEHEFGAIKIATVYLISGLGGSMLSALFLTINISVGASGALFGLLGAWIAEIITNWSRHSRNWVTLSQLVLLLAINLALGRMPHVDNYAHIGGCITGFLLGFVVLVRQEINCMRRQGFVMICVPPLRLHQNVLLVVAINILVVLSVVGVIMLFKGVYVRRV